ncbi:protein FAM124A isoform X2 [Pleurodeles waltl]|uniref:protein FAM124A isoform X2 n=1 Tax=Pleurodeles waltl TaxID=8319 RepID=UPI00370998FC
MEQKTAAEQDDCVDSGAETGGSEETENGESYSRSDYSRMSTTSSELSVEDVQDPFLVSIHIITDPGESRTLQEAIDKLLAWIHPDLQLFRVSERRISRKRRKPCKGSALQPALAVILFLQEEYGEEQILQLHDAFQRPPWQFHHTERVHGHFLPYMPCNQDFFTLANGTSLWAIRQVHYGKEIVRFTIYCSHENFADILKLYELILKRPVWQKKNDFCVFPVYSNMDIDIQFSLKRLPKGQTPTPMESSVLEFRVKDFGQLIPLLPNPCSPISEGRWQTEDHDGNKILLQQVHRSFRKPTKHNKWHTYTSRKCSTMPTASLLPRGYRTATDQAKLHRNRVTSQYFGTSQQDLIDSDPGDFSRRSSNASIASWSFQRSKSLFCLPTMSTFPSCESFSLSEPYPFLTSGTPRQKERGPSWRCSPRLNVDDLDGAQETDVDTGMKLSCSDLSIVSAYSTLNGFCGDLEASLPSETQSTGSSKRAIREGIRLPSKNNPLEPSCGSLPSPSEWPPSSLKPPSVSDLASVLPFKLSPRATTYSSQGGSQSTERTKQLSQPLSSPTCEEEEFYI